MFGVFGGGGAERVERRSQKKRNSHLRVKAVDKVYDSVGRKSNQLRLVSGAEKLRNFVPVKSAHFCFGILMLVCGSVCAAKHTAFEFDGVHFGGEFERVLFTWSFYCSITGV